MGLHSKYKFLFRLGASCREYDRRIKDAGRIAEDSLSPINRKAAGSSTLEPAITIYLPSRKAFEDYEAELRSLIARDMAHPSCVMRILFNETWGIWGLYGQGFL